MDTLSWMSANPKLALLNAALQWFALLVVYCLIGSLYLAIGTTTAIMSFIAIVHYLKMKMIGQPFYPWDIFLNKESMNIAPLVTGPATLKRIAVMGIIVLLLFMLRLILPRFGMRLVSRLTIGLVALFALYSFGSRAEWTTDVLYHTGVSETIWDQQYNYAYNGISLAFTLNVKNTKVPKPDGYGEHSIAALAQTISGQTLPAVPKEELNGQLPNVIFIMNEAFWDPTLLPDIGFSEDPLPTVHRLQLESTSGYLLSPQFGGGTSNVEYEVLTGQSMSFLPGGSVPYQQYIRKSIPTLASYFKGMGYASTAIHSYEGWFWNRQTVYKHFGFDQFKSKEQFEDPEYRGPFISDAEVSRSIAAAVEKSDSPMFVYAVTMQNHGPYDTARYATNTIEVQGNLTADAKLILETYTQGAYDADQSLQMLINHFEQVDEPTLIVFFGDHLPMLGYDYDVYQQGGLIKSKDGTVWSLEELKNMHSVPFVTWSNFSMPNQTWPVLSASFLGALMVDHLQLDKSPQFAFNSKLSSELPGLLSNLVVDSSGGLYKTVPEAYKKSVEEYRELQYDQLFGGQYLEKYYVQIQNETQQLADSLNQAELEYLEEDMNN
ncbi:MAG: sulfatase [Paenibacillus sp.]|nr:sulfatase [Paenibacillus sp.]